MIIIIYFDKEEKLSGYMKNNTDTVSFVPKCHELLSNSLQILPVYYEIRFLMIIVINFFINVGIRSI